MSRSQHPVALRLQRRVNGSTKLLATVMCLPLIDGIFPALVVAGALDDPLGIAEVGLLIFGGSATVAVILAEMDGTRRDQIGSVLVVGSVVLVVAAVEAALAPTIQGLLRMGIFKRFAGLVILSVAASTASARVGEWLPRPAVIVGAGLVASVDPTGATLAFTADPALVARGVAAAGTGVGFALAVAVLAPYLRTAVDIDRFRFGSAVALGVLPLSIFGIGVPAEAPVALAVLGVTGLLAFDPGSEVAGQDHESAAEGSGAAGPPVTDGGDTSGGAPSDHDSELDPSPGADDRSEDPATGQMTDDDQPTDDEQSGSTETYVTTDTERAPWL